MLFTGVLLYEHIVLTILYTVDLSYKSRKKAIPKDERRTDAYINQAAAKDTLLNQARRVVYRETDAKLRCARADHVIALPRLGCRLCIWLWLHAVGIRNRIM